MSRTMAKLPIGVQAVTARAAFAMPEPLRRAIAGSPVRVDGNELALDAQLLLRLVKLTEIRLAETTPDEARENLVAASPMAAGAPIQPIRVRDLRIPTETGGSPARLYTPMGLAEGSPLLVYFHGGGFVVGNLTTHDNTCRFLARHAELRVLSVDYRLAPEHPFPAAPADALAAFEFAAHHAAELGADPAAIAVGGDSAGGNLAAVTSYQTLRSGGPRPAFQLLFYPGTQLQKPTRSRELFADGYFLTDDDLNWFTGHYCPDPEQWRDPLASPLLAEDLHGMPPTYLATAGFDPLRDEGAAYAQRLRDAGVPVVYQCQTDLIHGYVNFIGLGRRFREAVAEAAGALRTGLALRSHAHADNLFGTREIRGPGPKKSGSPARGE
jgi:acetyl esterase